MNIRIAIADDHPMVIDGLKNMLSGNKHITLSGSYLNGDTLLKGLEKETPDVLLLDIQMPGKTGDELAPIILKLYPGIKLLTITNFDNALYANEMFKQGAHGYLLKTTDKDMLIQAIETVYRGEQFIEPTIKQKMQELSVHQALISRIRLTDREKEVLQLIVNGVTTLEIADTMNLSHNTVKNYRNSLLQQLQANNTATLVQKALKMGLAK